MDSGGSASDAKMLLKKSITEFSSRSSENSLTTIEILARRNSLSDGDDDPLLFTNDNSDNDDTGCDQNEVGSLINAQGNFLTKHSGGLQLGVTQLRLSGSVNGNENVLTDQKTFDAQAYFDKRVMSPLQERCNAITMLPNLIYCMYFVLAGCWLSSECIEMASQALHDEQDVEISTEQEGGWTDVAREVFGDKQELIDNNIG